MLVQAALTIAGSDSSGGAGIQADIKTMSALGVYSCTVITAITAQNTSNVDHIHPLDAGTVKKQIRSILSDIPIHAIKIGMVYNNEIITAVSDALNKLKIPIVLDPIISAGTGAQLLQKEFLYDFKDKLLPICDLVTPNIHEAEKLSEIMIKNEDDIKKVALKIQKLGAKNVVVKGGHFRKDDEIITDTILDYQGEFRILKNNRMKIVETHGSGCNFSAAVTAFIALQFPIVQACFMASQYVHNSIVNIVKIGRGIPVNNPISTMYEQSCRYNVIKELTDAVDELTSMNNFARLIPETQSNIVYAIPNAKSVDDVAGVSGRIVKAGERSVPAAGIKFGASRHVASSVLEYMKTNQLVRSAINIKNDKRVLERCTRFYRVAHYNRKQEPKTIKGREGRSVPWGISRALSANPDADVIYHSGDIGKEPMIIIFGQTPQEVVDKVKKVLEDENI
ncbi:MAG: bifunctional hydroxymethylpyrimidine kinase/phosphomethylpyrimidine kinase [Nitrososphaeraceae archaeon]|nr:bifunctional hydroxymethylpyrimidine kinase/phosphomethylpyrimidine kinase [Nitrososphaeraceae archaeon]MDW0227338.1 bifunctional hydroxymethylpyrimidine kinase/phosphomethylpyrimidine kinase [Nitrososphaeraceae archaeon]MDW0251723.1 bifunctional hydroxymethylpyrimidine kinase/phosphomethylpyrimidine kinase [Nitrososphaeraceae archaeon]MDW0267482.1 bifunctional hydroxymethylpyrimidine kinase/phosphomethylpyrimidine kinase [Nitrososphaeraceae archaeon]MDW0271379.1 bifunctional hydroxymethylpy